MKRSGVSWWQRLGSFLMPMRIETTASEHNSLLEVRLSCNRLQLSSHNAIYSYDDLYLNFKKAFSLIDLPPDQSEVLLLGLGLASVPLIAEQVYGRSYRWSAVEIDEAVVDLASRYTFPRLRSQIQVYCTDAKAYIHQCQQQFDMVIVDVFLDDQIPEYFEHTEAFQAIRDLVLPGGQVVLNRLYRSAADQTRSDRFHREVFAPVFPNSGIYVIDGSMILHATV